jgi:hypothetical protein
LGNGLPQVRQKQDWNPEGVVHRVMFVSPLIHSNWPKAQRAEFDDDPLTLRQSEQWHW